MKVIVDTNVFVSGLFWAGPPRKILNAWHEQTIRLIVSPEIFKEYERVSKALSEKYSGIDLDRILQLVAIYAEMYTPVILEQQVSRDRDDDKFIACALAANVALIVSGDQNLLSVSGYRGIEIISPAHFVKTYLTV